MSEKHLDRNVARPLGDAERMAGIVRGMARKRLRYTDLIPPRDVRSLHAGEPI